MQYKPWMDFITPDDIPNDDLRNVEAFAKYETALALMLYCPGMTISVPTLRFSKAKRRYYFGFAGLYKIYSFTFFYRRKAYGRNKISGNERPYKSAQRV